MSIRAVTFCFILFALLGLSVTLSASANSPRRRVAKRETKKMLTASESKKAQFHKKTRYRSNVCWRLARDVRRSVQVQHRLLRRFVRYRCDVSFWKRCQRNGFSRKSCRGKRQKLRWGGCFRLHRRLFVVTHRLFAWKKESKKNRCRWNVRIPASFEQVLFAPFPRLAKK